MEYYILILLFILLSISVYYFLTSFEFILGFQLIYIHAFLNFWPNENHIYWAVGFNLYIYIYIGLVTKYLIKLRFDVDLK